MEVDPNSVGRQTLRQKSKVLRVVLLMPESASEQAVQLDTVAIVGFANEALDSDQQCPGLVVLADGRTGICSGRGVCKPRGCHCHGNFGGYDCGKCRFGWEGSDCKYPTFTRRNLPKQDMCSPITIVYLNELDTAGLLTQWAFRDYTFHSTSAVPYYHFGTRLQTPLLRVPEGTHIRIRAGFLVSDLSKHFNSGLEVRIATTQLTGTLADRTEAEQDAASERVVFVKRVPYLTGVNVVGSGKGDTFEEMDVVVPWPHATMSLLFLVWSPDISDSSDKGSHRFTLTYMNVEACRYPVAAAYENPVTRDMN